MLKKLLLLLVLQLIFSGCTKPIADPQLDDYIYQSLKQDLVNAETQLSEKQTQLKDFKSNLLTADIQTSEFKLIRTKSDYATQEIRKLEQRVKYWKGKLLTREKFVRNEYLSAFNKGESWNNLEEILKYKKAKNHQAKLLKKMDGKEQLKNEEKGGE